MLPFPSSSGIGVLLGIALPRCCSTSLSIACSLHPSAPFCCSGIGVLVGIAQALFNSLSRMTVRALRCGPANATNCNRGGKDNSCGGLHFAADPGCGSCVAGAATVAHVTCRVQLSPHTTAADLTMPLPLSSHSSTLAPRVLAASVLADLSMPLPLCLQPELQRAHVLHHLRPGSHQLRGRRYIPRCLQASIAGCIQACLDACACARATPHAVHASI